jgi:hypothetical protein
MIIGELKCRKVEHVDAGIDLSFNHPDIFIEQLLENICRIIENTL